MQKTSDKKNQIDLLLLGKTGNGKSATGNSILQRTAFKSSGSTTSITRTTCYEVSEFKGRSIKVVDGPGIGDTQLDNEHAVVEVVREITRSIVINPTGYNAFVIVLKITKRFTTEEQDVITLLKKIFGENFVSDFCIIVMTCGDVFEKEMRSTGLSFTKWCANQRGPFKNLLDECNNRVVLFDNFVKDKVAKEKQLKNLLKVVDNLSVNRTRYTNINFSMAEEARRRIMREAKVPMILETAMTELSLILHKFRSSETCEDDVTRVKLMDAASQRTEKLCKMLENTEVKTGEVEDLHRIVICVKLVIWEQMEFKVRSIDDSVITVAGHATLARGLDAFQDINDKDKHLKRREKVGENEEYEEKFLREAGVDNCKQSKNSADLEKEYRELKEKHDENLMSQIISSVNWSFRYLGDLFD